MNDANFQRAQLLYAQGRFDLAADTLREGLAQTPQNPLAHALLGLCLMHQKRYDEATAEASEAIHIAPDNSYCHYVSGVIYLERNRFPEAEISARESLRLAPEDADHWSLLSQVLFARQRWPEALAAADQGLQYQPEHTNCINLRAMALVKLGEKQAASQTIAGALKLNPHSALSHANQGWALLHQNDPQQALVHFREALRIDPNNQWARDGTMEALKARHLVYRLMLRYYLWMSRFSRRGQWGIIVGFWIAIQILNAVKTSRPELAPYIYPLLIAYGIFVLASWLTDSVFNLTLLLNPYGRHLLSTQKRVGALVVGTLLLGAIALIPVGFLNDSAIPLLAGGLMLLLSLPTAATARCRPGKPVLAMTAYTIAIAIVGIIGIIKFQNGDADAPDYLIAAVWGSVLSSLAGNVLMSMIPKK